MTDAEKQIILEGLDLIAQQARFARDYEKEADANVLYAKIKAT